MPATYQHSRTILRGINDISLNAPATQREEIATHAPHCFILAERGGTGINFHTKVSAAKAFGDETFKKRSKFYNHQTLLIDGFFAEANSVGIQRLIPTDALPPAGFILWADVLEEDIAQYQIDPNTGKFLLDSGGNKVPTDPASVVAGVSIKYTTTPMHRVNAAGTIITQSMVDDFESGNTSIDIVAVANTFGANPSMEGGRSFGGTNSTMYKIGEFSLDEVGAFGNRAAIRLFPVTETSPFPPTDGYVEEVGSFPFRMQVLYSENENSTPSVVETVSGGRFSQFSFQEGAIDTYDADLFADVRLNDDWDMAKFTGSVVESGPLFANIHLFYDNITAICNMIGNAEATANPDFFFSEETDTHKINFMTGVNFDDTPYIAVNVLGSADNGINLTPVTNLAAVGGSDGTISDDVFDELVATQCNNFGDLKNKVLDMARYPTSAIYDTGFSMDTKAAVAKVPALRKDYVAGFTPWSHGIESMSESEHLAACTAVSNIIRTYTESDYYSTSATRYFIVGQIGRLTSSDYRGVVPGIYPFLLKIAGYMGAANKRWKSVNSPDFGSNKDVKDFYIEDLTYLSPQVREQYHKLGVMMAIYRDRDTLFYPVQSSSYKNSDSVLSSIITVYALADVEKIANVVWADLVGNTKLTDEQYVEDIRTGITNELIARNFYDDRFVVDVNPYYTPEDKLSGKSIHIKVTMSASKGKDIFDFTINAADRASLTQ